MEDDETGRPYPNHGCRIVMESPFGKSHCTTCGRQWEAMTPQGSENHCVREIGSALMRCKEEALAPYSLTHEQAGEIANLREQIFRLELEAASRPGS